MHAEALSFGELLSKHLRRGKRAGGNSSRAWRNADFADKIGVSERTLRNWINGKTCPVTLEAIERELFASNLADEPARLELRDAFAVARRRASALPAELLVPPDRCFGRSAEAAALTAALVGSSATTLAILGSPGIGKTTLTRYVATSSAVVERFGERRWFVELETAVDAAALRTAIQLAVSLDPAFDNFPRALALLGKSPGLLMLDNLEVPWERDMEAVQDCLRQVAAVPNIKLLVSLRGNVAPTGPAFMYQQVLSPIKCNEAQRLFLDIARNISPRDPVLRHLLCDLGGLPLAIELMATRAAPYNSLDDIWAEWGRHGIAMATHPDLQGGRLTSVMHSIDLSVQSPRLRAPGRRLFRLLGQWPGGLAHVDAAALLRDHATEAIRQLLAIGLAFSCGEGRINLLPPMRQFALSMLPTSEIMQFFHLSDIHLPDFKLYPK